MKQPLLCLLFILALTALRPALADTTTTIPHDYISCSVLTLEQLTLLQLAQRGVSREEAKTQLPLARKQTQERIDSVYDLISKEGILNSYSFINSNYARCTKLVHSDRGTPARDLKEYGYYFCAGENKLRYEIILRTNLSFDIDRVLADTPDSHFDVAITYFKLIEKEGLLAAFDYNANNLKACLQRLN